MNFEKIHAELLSGKKIRRKAWGAFQHLCLIDGQVQAFHGETIEFYGNPGLLVTKDWYVVGAEERKLSFVDALFELKQGKYLAHGESKEFLFIHNGELAICRQMAYDFMPTFKDLCSNDWETMK